MRPAPVGPSPKDLYYQSPGSQETKLLRDRSKAAAAAARICSNTDPAIQASVYLTSVQSPTSTSQSVPIAKKAKLILRVA